VLWHCRLSGRKGIQRIKKWGWWRWALVSPGGVVPSRMVGVSASVNLPLHHKVQKFSSGIGSPGWSRKKGHKTVVVWWCNCNHTQTHPILRAIFSESELTFTFAICCCPFVCLSVCLSVRLSVCLSVCPSVCLSVVANACAPYSASWNFWQYFYVIWYLGLLLTSVENFTRSSQGTPLSGALKARGVAKYSDLGPIKGFISETVQDRR